MCQISRCARGGTSRITKKTCKSFRGLFFHLTPLTYINALIPKINLAPLKDSRAWFHFIALSLSLSCLSIIWSHTYTPNVYMCVSCSFREPIFAVYVFPQETSLLFPLHHSHLHQEVPQCLKSVNISTNVFYSNNCSIYLMMAVGSIAC